MSKIALIIPCYNEALRLDKDQIHQLLKNHRIDIYLSNDGSTDKTLELLETIQKLNIDRVFVENYTENQGKSKTIYKTISKLILSKKEYAYFGYLDADFATSCEEFINMFDFIENNPNYNFIFGSRISTLNSTITRSQKRHFIGRVIITLLNLKFNLKIYDTQCGAKIFTKDVINICFQEPFLTKWLFDIEIFLRLRERELLTKGYEYPLSKWEDKAGSKITFRESFTIILDLLKIVTKY